MFRGEAEPKPHCSVKRVFWCFVWAHGGGCSAAGIWEQMRLEGEQIQALRGLHEYVIHFDVIHFLLNVTAYTSK